MNFNDCMLALKLLLEFWKFWDNRNQKSKDPPTQNKSKTQETINQSETNKPV